MQKRTLFANLFLSYLLILILPIVFSLIIVYGKFITTLEKEKIKSSESVLLSTRQIVDSHLDKITNYSYSIAENRELRRVLNSTSNANEMTFSLRNLITDLSRYNALLDISDIIMLVFPEKNFILTHQTKYPITEYFEDIIIFEKYPPHSIVDKITSTNFRNYIPSTEVHYRNHGRKNMLTYIQKLNTQEKTTEVYMAVLIDEQKIFSLIGDYFFKGNKSFAILDRSNKIVTSTGSQDIFKSLNHKNIQLDKPWNIKYKNDRYFGVYSLSNVIDWNYIFLIPERELFEKAAHIKLIFILLLLSCILFGIILAYYLSKINYQPVQNILRYIGEKTSFSIESGCREWEAISGAIRKSLLINKELRQQLQDQLPVMRSSFLRRLLYEKGYEIPEINKYLDLYGIQLPFPHYLVMLAQTEKFGTIEKRSRDSEYAHTFTNFMIMQMIEQTMKPHHPVYVVEMDINLYAVLVNGISLSNGNREHFSTILKSLQKAVRQDLYLVLHLGVGTPCDSLALASDSYREAELALNFTKMRNGSGITYYDEMDSESNTIYYPVETERCLLNHLKTGEYDQVDRYVSEIQKNNFESRHLSPQMMRCVLYNLASTAWKALEETHIKAENITEELENFDEVITRNTSENVFNNLREIFKNICKIIAERKRSKNISLRDRILDFIHNNYANPGLSLVMVADTFNISTIYLSMFFKEQIGLNYGDYVNRYRIKKSCDLLERDEMSIEQISLEVGYLSSNTFIRVFKRYNSITPGQYRKSAC